MVWYRLKVRIEEYYLFLFAVSVLNLFIIDLFRLILLSYLVTARYFFCIKCKHNNGIFVSNQLSTQLSVYYNVTIYIYIYIYIHIYMKKESRVCWICITSHAFFIYPSVFSVVHWMSTSVKICVCQGDWKNEEQKKCLLPYVTMQIIFNKYCHHRV